MLPMEMFCVDVPGGPSGWMDDGEKWRSTCRKCIVEFNASLCDVVFFSVDFPMSSNVSC
jgi:hypothetical protein